MSEKIRILQRLEIIQDRLNEIQAYNDVKAGQMQTAEPGSHPKESRKDKIGF